MARRTKKKSEEPSGQRDPRAALDAAALLDAARPVLARLRADLAQRAAASPAVAAALEARHAAEQRDRRTADGLAAWRDRFVAQVAASWFLSCVFVRTLEDRGLLGRNRLAGPGATDSQTLFFSLAPSLTERDYLLAVFREMTRLSAARALFDAAHCPVWLLAPSADAARELLGLFRLPTADEPAFRFGQPSTRFLGDLYQDLDDEVRKRYALLQTPDFVESFILDRTLEPAIEKFGLDDTTLIDPTCGSGHFLLGAFDRLFHHHLRRTPDLGERRAAELAVDAVFGADINPYAVAIARFRLTLAYLDKAGYGRLADAPALPLHLVVADSLLHNPQHAQGKFAHMEGQSAEAWSGQEFALEDEAAARDVLFRQYAAVVGNPPYITEKDSARREVYREMYPRSAGGKYALAAPFCERFFQLGREGGFVGQITANSFMKREYGKKLIEEFLKTVNLEKVVNTSGAFIPGHGTPTLLLFGTAEAPRDGEVLTVLAKRGEPTTPVDPSRGEVWSSIVGHWDEVGFENDYISVARTERGKLGVHPWSLGGGGAVELKELLEERAIQTLGSLVESVGISSFTLEDDVFLRPREAWTRLGISENRLRPMVIGEAVRDWSMDEVPIAFFPYDDDFVPIPESPLGLKALWPYRTTLANNKLFGGKTKVQGGLKWYEYGRLTAEKLRTPLTITFAFVATHNHFVLDRGGKVFKQTAPIIKLPDTATEDDHLALLAYLNSSTACFWMKQVFFDKGNRGEGGGITAESWEKFFEFDGTKLRDLPIPSMDGVAKSLAAERARRLHDLADEVVGVSKLEPLFEHAKDATTLAQAVEVQCAKRDRKLAELKREQESLDWWIYSLFGLSETSPSLATEVRPSDVLFARRVSAGDVGARYFDLCRLPRPDVVASAEAPAECLASIEAKSELALIETPTYKRTFREGFRPVDMDRQAIGWLTSRIEDVVSRSQGSVTHLAVGQALTSSPPVVAVLDLVTGGHKHAGVAAVAAPDAIDVAQVLKRILEREAVPFASAFLFSLQGLKKHAEWLALWEGQRREDRGEKVTLKIPSKYGSADFQAASFFSLRGKLDVPKERFISYPGCESDRDGEPVYGWAGWNHLQRAQALATLYQNRKTEEGWTADRLTPMLAGLLELLPWIKQWHNEPDAEFGGLRMGDYFEQFLDAQLHELKLTRKDLLDWRPTKKGRGRKPRTATATAEKADAATTPRKRGRKRKGGDSSDETTADNTE